MALDDQFPELERIPFLRQTEINSNDELQHFSFQGIWNRVGFLISVVVGVYAGMNCQTMRESWLYGASFCGEALICAGISRLVRAPTFKRSIFTIGVWFMVSGIVTPITGGLHIGE
jgi:galactitol-specific phosphotransferase system IIC component